VSEHRLNSRRRPSAPARNGWRIWDTSYVDDRKSFALYREAACESFLRLSPQRPNDQSFFARVEHFPLASGAVNRVSTVPHDVIRTTADVARIDGDFLHLNFQIGGQYKLVQAGRESIVNSGDAVLFSTAKPFTMNHRRGRDVTLMSLLIPRKRLASTLKSDLHLDNLLVSRLRYGGALRSCLAVLAGRLNAASRHEIEMLNSATVSLLCAALAADEHGDPETWRPSDSEPAILAAIKLYVRENLARPNLSAESIAPRFGISRRYVDKLFQNVDRTFETFLQEERLSCARLDLLDPSMLREKVSTIAYRWGFRDLSSFHRNFKALYGETPGSLRG